jgi:TPR repeat protein
MPEVPSNMQQGLANLELEAREVKTSSGNQVASLSTAFSHSTRVDSFQQRSHTRESSQSSTQPHLNGPGFTATYDHTNASAYQNLKRQSLQQFGGSQVDSSKFSPFPKLRDAGENVPLSDDEKEEVLERARPLVLKSSDPEMQLAWAQDALSWVEVANQASTRQQSSEDEASRSITPKVEHQLRVDALNIVCFLADQHHPKAEFMKGMWLEFGKFDYRVDKKEAFLAYRRAAERGYARAEYRIGMQYESSNNSVKAIEHYQKGVAMKDSASNYRLGMMTLLGQHGTQQNYQRGVDLIRFAAETSDENAPQGAYVYGMLLARELPNINIPEQYLPYDFNEAKLFIEKAAYLGFAKAQLKMGQAYELCQLGCEFDPALSLHYNALAARQGEAEADMAISKWFLCGYEGIFEKNEELAFTYAKRAAQTKMATAEFALGYFYEIGMYVPIDLHESEIWYRKASEHGNTDALGRIDSIKKNNTFSKKDHEQIAISRIKSQYGSQRGGRPERFKQRPPSQMPTMSEDTVDIPDPRDSFVTPINSQPRRSSNIPVPRPVSTAPYPEDDMPPPSRHANLPYHNQGLRPSSAAGYSAAGPQADRPSSAFGIRPVNNGANEPYGQNDNFNPTEPLRLSTSMTTMAVPNGRGSDPAARDRIVSASWEPQLPPPNRDSSPGRQFSSQVANPSDGRSRLQKTPQININKPQPLGPQQPQPFLSTGYAADPSRKPFPQSQVNSASISRRDPSANQLQRPERGSSMTPVSSITSPPVQRPPKFDSMSPAPSPSYQGSTSSTHSTPHNSPYPNSPYQISPMINPTQSPPISNSPYQNMGPSRSSQRPPHNSQNSQGTLPASPLPPPKKQGPATFEEMGIPIHKPDSECVSLQKAKGLKETH